jgi:hypothetical protein
MTNSICKKAGAVLSVADPDPDTHHFGTFDLDHDPHQSEVLDQDPEPGSLQN